MNGGNPTLPFLLTRRNCALGRGVTFVVAFVNYCHCQILRLIDMIDTVFVTFRTKQAAHSAHKSGLNGAIVWP